MAIQSDHEFAPTQIARAVFPTAFRGYDQDAVRRFLSRLAAALEHQQEYAGLGELEARTPAHERVEELEDELEDLRTEIKDLELELVQRSVEGGSDGDGAAKPAADAAPFDEHRAIELLGQETARVLESARSAAADILKRAETQAASLKAQAKSELAEARRRSKTIVADKRAESEEQAARVADEAQTQADRLRSEAEEHRVAVVDESSKILAEAEQLAEVEQAQSEERAKQIVADAETLRQQVISELVSEQRQSKAEMDRMTAARDRLAMSLAVARSELDEVADALVDASTIAPDVADGGVMVGERDKAEQPSHEEQVNSLVEELEAKQADAAKKQSGARGGRTAKGAAKKKRAKRSKQGRTSTARSAGGQTGSKKHAATDDESEVLDSTEAPADEDGEQSNGGDGPIKTGSALFADTADGEDTSADDDTGDDAGDDTAELESPDQPGVADGGPDGQAPVSSDELASDAGDPDSNVDLDDPVTLGDPIDLDGSLDLDDTVEVIEVGAEINKPPPAGQELSLVEGFTTIELTEADLADRDEESDEATIDLRDPDSGDGENTPLHSGGGDVDRSLVTAVVAAEGQEPEEFITTVSSRTASAKRDRTRGDLLIDEPFTGRLAKEFSARDLALTRSGPNFRRQLRRALNDDQSDVLDRLRAGRGDIKVDELPPFADQIDRYLAPLRRGLAEIAQAGAKAGGKNDLSQTALDNLVRQLAKYIVDKVRMPTIDVIQQTTDHDRERILEPIRALYRDFRNVGLSDLTEDALYEAFAIGLYDSIEPSAPLSWVIDPRSDPDPVCDINSQRDDVVKGVVFPSGHARPLSLPGCRCLVMLGT